MCRSASDDARFGLLSNLFMVLVMKQSFEYGTPKRLTMIEGLKLTSNTGIFEFLALSLLNIYFRKYQDSLMKKVEDGILCFVDCLFRWSFFMCILYDNFFRPLFFVFL